MVTEPDRYVNVYCDWGAYGVWDRRGRAVYPTDLPIPHELASWILGWQARFEDIPLEDVIRKPRGEAFDREGRAIVAALRVVLPDWTVVYDQTLEPDS
jgi:hypothetical protein